MADNAICDDRPQKDFSQISFSGFKKTDVKKELITTMYNSQLEEACYWGAELVCAGHFVDLWDVIIYFFSKYVHVGNPKISIYLDRRMDVFKNIINDNTVSDLDLRNNLQIREIFGEIVSILCGTVRSHQYSEVIVTADDFNMCNDRDRFKAPSVKFNTNFLPHDPEELFAAVNELSYNLSVSNCMNSWYWVEWLMAYDGICRKNKRPCFCEERELAPVHEKFKKDLAWMVWDVIVTHSKTFSPAIQAIILSAIHMYAVKYTSSVQQFKRRKYLFYFAVEMITGQIVLRQDFIQNKDFIKNVVDNIGGVYKQIKTNEQNKEDDAIVHPSNLNANLETSMTKMRLAGSVVIR